MKRERNTGNNSYNLVEFSTAPYDEVAVRILVARQNNTNNPFYKNIELEKVIEDADGKAKECYSMKLDLLTNSTMVDDAIRFVSDRSKEKPNHLLSAVTKMTKKESNESYDEEPRETSHTAITTNEVF